MQNNTIAWYYKLGVFGIVCGIVLFFAAIAGWVMNIVTIAHNDFTSITGMLIMRIVGVFIPIIGAVLGWI